MSAWFNGAPQGTNLDYAYEYDLAGNRIARQTQAGAAQSETFPAAGGGTFTALATPIYASANSTNGLNQLTARSGGSGTVPVFIKGKANEPVSVTVNGAAATVTADPASTTGGDLFSTWAGLGQGGNAVAIQATDQGPAGANVTTKTAAIYVAGASGANKSYSYDNNGNCTGYTSSAGNVTYTWDAEDRLRSASKGGTTMSFAYDGLSRCVGITNTTGGTATTAKFVWSGSTRCGELERGVLSRLFYAEGEVIDGTDYYFRFDALGSVRGVTEDSGAVAANYDYDTYGNQTNLYGTTVADFGFAGYFEEPNSGLYLTHYRAYDPDSGRWLNRDPMQERGGMDLYDYVGNNPITRTDPLGLGFAEMFQGFNPYGQNGPTEDGLPPEQPMLPPKIKSPGDFDPSTPQEKLEDIQKAQKRDPAAIRCIGKTEQNDKNSLRPKTPSPSAKPPTPAPEPTPEPPPVETPIRYIRFVNPETGETTFKEIGGEGFGGIDDNLFDDLIP